MVDRNVHFQDTVRLAQRLLELRKENWEVALGYLIFSTAMVTTSTPPSFL